MNKIQGKLLDLAQIIKQPEACVPYMLNLPKTLYKTKGSQIF